MAHARLRFRITGLSPLVCHNGALADPLNPIAREMRAVSGKRKKTDADHEALARFEFLGSLYLTDSEPVIPGELLEAGFIAAAKKVRMGPQATAGIVSTGTFPILYDGSCDPHELWKDERFRLRVGVRIQKSRIIRTRPIFRDWAAEVSFDYLPTLLNERDVREIVERLGAEVGIGDWRPKFGRFRAEVVQ